MSKNYYNRGYVSILILFIALAVIAYLAATQYQRLVSRKAASQGGYDTSGEVLTPIDRAQEAKELLEKRDQSLFGE